MGQPPTILFVAWAPFFSGAERALLLTVENLDRRRHRPVVVLGTDGELARELRLRDVTTHVVPLVRSGARRFPAWLTCVARLARIAKRERAVLVHANDAPSFQPAGYAARWLGLPAVTHVRFPDNRNGFAWFLKPGFGAALFVSDALRQEALVEAPDVFEGRCQTVYDGVLLPALPDEAGRLALRDELGLPRDRPIVAMTGQVAEVKGIWEFIDAAEQVARRGLPVHFAVLGDDLKGKGAFRREAEQAVVARGLSHVVQFLGFRPGASTLIAAFDVVAVPSHVEPLGNATLEAMAAGRPVIGARVGGIPEMVVDGVTGLLVPTRDATRLAQAIEMLIGDPARMQAYGAAGRARAADVFSLSAHTTRVQAIYDQLLGATAARDLLPT